MRNRLPLLVVLVMLVALVLTACGDATNTPGSAATTASATTSAAAATTSAAATSAAATTAAMTSAAATTAAMTSAAATTSAMTSAAATTSAMTSAAATTASGTTASATTAAGSTTGSSSAFALQPIAKVTGPKGGTFTNVSLAELAPELGVYPSAGGYTDSYSGVAALIWGGALIQYNYVSLKWELDAAKSLSVSSDSKVFTFTLRDDLKWSDGKPITVEDYKFGYDGAIKEDKANADQNFVGLDDFKRITKVDIDPTAKTVVVTLDDVYAADLALSYVAAVAPVPRQVYGSNPFFDASKNPEITKPTVTSGPYMVQAWDAKTQGVLVPNPNWYGGTANFDKQVFKPGSASVVYQLLTTGQADWAVNIPPAQYAQAKANTNVKIVDWNAVNGSFRYVEYNTKRTPMNDKAFRSAINYAIDRTALIKLAENGLGTPQYSFLTPDSPFYNKGVNQYAFNLDTAKKTLADAGYKLDGSNNLLDKTGKAVEVTVVFPTSSNPRKLIATYLQQQLKQLGIKVNVDGKEFQAYTKQLKAQDFDISLSTSGGGFPDPDNFKSNIISGGQQNNSSYANPTVDKLFEQGNKETDTAKRKDIYNQIQQLISDDTPVFFLWNITNFSAFSSKAQNVTATKSSYLWDSNNQLKWSLAQ